MTHSNNQISKTYYKLLNNTDISKVEEEINWTLKAIPEEVQNDFLLYCAEKEAEFTQNLILLKELHQTGDKELKNKLEPTILFAQNRLEKASKITAHFTSLNDHDLRGRIYSINKELT